MGLEPGQAEGWVRGSGPERALSRGAGAVVAVVGRDGVETVRLGQGVDAETPVQVASVTKALTGLLLADAVLRGEMRLEATVDELLLGEAARKDSVTALQLATHTSGLPRLSIGARRLLPDPYRGYTREHLLRYLRRRRPVLPAARGYAYSNLGFAVLGLMLERACGARYAELLRARVLAPLGMGRTEVALTGSRVRVERGYGRLGGSPVWLGRRPPVWHHDAYAPCGGVVSTAGDLVAMVQGLLEREGELAAAFGVARQERAEIPGGAIGLGWHLPGSRRFAWHNGATFGHSAYVAVAPEFGVAVVGVANQAVAQPLTVLGHALMKQALA